MTKNYIFGVASHSLNGSGEHRIVKIAILTVFNLGYQVLCAMKAHLPIRATGTNS